MKTHVGMALIPVKPWSRAEVVIDFVDGYMVTWSTEGRWLGSWPANEVGTDLESASRLLLTLGTETVRFELAYPASFRAALEGEIDRIESMTRIERLWKSAVLRSVPLLGRDAFVRIALASERSTAPIGGEESAAQASSRPAEAPSPARTVVADPTWDTLTERERSLRSVMEAAQEDVVVAMRLGMEAWLGFYLRLADGTGRVRLERATTGLKDASLQMRDIALHVTAETEPETPEQKQAVDTYCKAVENWAEAFDRIARAVESDQQHLAQAGFDLFESATEAACDVVLVGSRTTSSVRRALDYLEGLTPPVKVSSKAVKRAKDPWKAAIIAAGAPLRWSTA